MFLNFLYKCIFKQDLGYMRGIFMPCIILVAFVLILFFFFYYYIAGILIFIVPLITHEYEEFFFVYAV